MIKPPFAIALPGPLHKVYQSLPTHTKTGVTLHTAEYDLPDDDKVLYNALMEPARQASWHYTITKPPFAFVFAHYEPGDTCWHCGYEGNLWTVGIELEGYAPDKISGPQYGLLVKLLKWIREERGWQNGYHRGLTLNPQVEDAQFYEHKDWMPTLCQVFSRGMIDAEQLIRDLKEEPMPEPFTEEQEERIKKIIEYEGPGLEMQARIAVSRALRGTEAAIMSGDWDALPGRLLTIKELAQAWSRWEE